MPLLQKISKREQFPRWFKIENYAATQSFTLADWYVNLEARNQAYACDWLTQESTHLNAIWQRPIRLATTQIVAALPAVSPFPLAQLNQLPAAELKQNIAFLTDQQSTPELHLTINMAAPDEVIIAELKSLLSSQRKASGLTATKARKAFNKRDLCKWRDYQLLACADLILYEMVTSSRISDSLFADIVFFHDVAKNFETIRKTVRPMVEELLFKNLFFLQAQVRSEVAAIQSHQQRLTKKT